MGERLSVPSPPGSSLSFHGLNFPNDTFDESKILLTHTGFHAIANLSEGKFLFKIIQGLRE